MGREKSPTSDEVDSRSHSRQDVSLKELSQSRNGSGRRSPARNKSRGSLPDNRKAISRASSRAESNSGFANFKEREAADSDADGEDNMTRATSEPDVASDSGWDTDLEIEGTLKRKVKEEYDSSGRALYREACRLNGVVPVSYFLRNIKEKEIVMMHHGLGPAGAKAIAIALVSNTTVINLNLSDNWLESEGGISIAEMLKENCYIAELTLSDNHLTNSAASVLAETFQLNTNLTHITLSGNDFDDKAAEIFAEVVLNNSKIEHLDLSHNNFGEAAGLILGPAISENITIRNFDLSWNNIRRKGAVALAKGIGGNIGLRAINLSWNGMGNEGAQALGEALKMNSSLEELDITNNRISAEGAVLLAKGLLNNETMKVLKVGKNPMQTAGCYGICKVVKDSPNTTMEEMDFTDIQVNKDFEDLFKELKELHPNIKCKHGGSGEETKKKPKMNPLLKLKRYIEKNNLRLVDFFQKFDKDGSMSVSYDEFREGLEESGIEMVPEEVDFLISELDKDGDGDINYRYVMAQPPCGDLYRFKLPKFRLEISLT